MIKDIERRLIENSVLTERFASEYAQAQNSVREQTIEKVNDLVYNLAKEHGVSVYEICANFVPEVEQTIEQPPIRGIDPFDRTTMKIVSTIKLKMRE